MGKKQKWSLKYLKKYILRNFKKELKKNEIKEKEIFQGCFDVIIKTLISCEPQIVKGMNVVGNRQKCCFELYGFDIMFDQNFKPWVLEVNCLPSLSSSSAFDKDVKTKLVCDTLNLLGLRGYNKKVLEKRLKNKQELMYPIFNQSFDKSYIEDRSNIYKI